VSGMWSGAELDGVLAARADLAASVGSLRAQARAAAPGRTAAIVESRMRQLLLGEAPSVSAETLDAAERVVVDLTEQFMIDAHGIQDELTGRLRAHYDPAEIVAIFFHLALTDGFVRLERVVAPEVASSFESPPGGR